MSNKSLRDSITEFCVNHDGTPIEITHQDQTYIVTHECFWELMTKFVAQVSVSLKGMGAGEEPTVELTWSDLDVDAFFEELSQVCDYIN